MKERYVFCAVCGTKFRARSYSHKYCSDKCAKTAENKRNREKCKHIPIFGERVCKKCGKTYTGHFNSRYCDACLDVGCMMHMLRDRRKYMECDFGK